jgi:hypothetical protein
VPALVAGMVAGANSINDRDLLRRGAMGRLFSVVRAPSTLSILLRAFTFGICQFDAVLSRFLHHLLSSSGAPAAGQRCWAMLGRQRFDHGDHLFAQRTQPSHFRVEISQSAAQQLLAGSQGHTPPSRMASRSLMSRSCKPVGRPLDESQTIHRGRR